VIVVKDIITRLDRVRTDANQILSSVESAKGRRFTLDTSYDALGKLSVKQDDLLRQALRCVEHELYRAAHVMAWAGFIDFLHEKLGEDGFAKLNGHRNWNVKVAEDLRNWSDFQVVEAAKDCGLVGKTLMKALHGLLNKRNECAHPEDYFPTLNDTLGYIEELFKRLATLQSRPL